MKNITILLVMFISAGAFSQNRDIGRMDRTDKVQMSSEERAVLTSKKMALALDLTEVQRVEIEKIHLEQINERKERMAVRRESARENASKQYDRSNKNLDRRLAHQEKMKEILTEEQYKKWKESAKRTHGKNNSVKNK